MAESIIFKYAFLSVRDDVVCEGGLDRQQWPYYTGILRRCRTEKTMRQKRSTHAEQLALDLVKPLDVSIQSYIYFY